MAPAANFVQSLARGLSVIRALSSREPMTLSDVARASGLTRASARRFVLTLEELGYVSESAGRFALTPLVLELGFAYLSALALPEVAHPHMERLVERVHESSSVCVLDGESVVYVARVPTQRIMNVVISVGTRLPAYATSMGRVLLAGLEPAERARRLALIELAPLANGRVMTQPQLEAELGRIAADGYAIVDQELELGLRSVAAPIRDRRGQVVAAINLAVQAGRVSVAQIKASLVGPLLETAAAIERDLGALPDRGRPARD
jgi:IclR family pca regulon transcriptional regulator